MKQKELIKKLKTIGFHQSPLSTRWWKLNRFAVVYNYEPTNYFSYLPDRNILKLILL